jgi:hypothetical protein
MGGMLSPPANTAAFTADVQHAGADLGIGNGWGPVPGWAVWTSTGEIREGRSQDP